jgi:hypothetical protein
MKFAVSKQLTNINGAPVALSATPYPVKILILRSYLGLTAVDSDASLVYATAGKIGSGGVLVIESGVHKEIDLAETYVQTSATAVQLHVLALD